MWNYFTLQNQSKLEQVQSLKIESFEKELVPPVRTYYSYLSIKRNPTIILFGKIFRPYAVIIFEWSIDRIRNSLRWFLFCLVHMKNTKCFKNVLKTVCFEFESTLNERIVKLKNGFDLNCFVILARGLWANVFGLVL